MMEFSQRKPNRLKEYDYSQCGTYFITVCVQDRHEILCKIVDSSNDENHHGMDDNNHGTPNEHNNHGAPGTSPPTVQLTEYGEIVEMALKSIHLDDVNLSVDIYAIMPDHVHFILTIAPIVGADVPGGPHENIQPGDPQFPYVPETRNPQMQIVPRVMTWFKRFTNKAAGFNIWQRSYHDRIIRDYDEYIAICQYIADNPARWLHR